MHLLFSRLILRMLVILYNLPEMGLSSVAGHLLRVDMLLNVLRIEVFPQTFLGKILLTIPIFEFGVCSRGYLISPL
jgi:hypothetical protein